MSVQVPSITWEQLSDAAWNSRGDNQPSPQLFELSRPSVLGSCDAFVSHSWRDDADAKWDALQSWNRNFTDRFGRSPSVWLDKA